MSTNLLHMIADRERQRRAREQRSMAVARERFTYNDSTCGPTTIGRGELVALEHEAVAGHPERFDIPARTRDRGYRPELNGATAVAAPAREELPRPSWALDSREPGLLPAADVELRDTTSPVSVRLLHGTRDDLRWSARAVPIGFETGGLLIRRQQERNGKIDITQVWAPGPATRCRRNSVALDWRTEHSRAHDLSVESGANQIVAGCWHVHPGDDASGEPSAGDLQMFGAAMADASNRVYPLDHYCGIIATDVERSDGPELHAWVVRRERDSEFAPLICERAEIIR